MDEQLERVEPKNPAFSPREFVLRYIRYIPLLIISTLLFLVLAYIKLRYSTDIYEVKSKLLVKSENSSGGQSMFQDMFLMSGAQNLSDEIEILKSTGLSKRIITALDLQTSYYNKGKVKATVIHPQDGPFKLQIL